MPSKPEVHKKYMREVWYPANKHKQQLMNRRRRGTIRKYIESKKIGGCSQCPEKESCCLDFHHTGSKKIGIAKLSLAGWSWKRIDEELAKCILLCSNCHRKLHARIISIAV
jgi:hypothetical protein